MNDREQFDRQYICNKQASRLNEHGDYVLPSIQDAWAGWKACAESKQSELDKANARIAQLGEALKLLFYEAKYQSTIGGWTDRFELDVAKSRIDESFDTWLSEHDKAVEVKVLEEAAQKCRYYLKNQNYQIYENTNDPYEHGVIIAAENIENILIEMIESRK